MIAFLFRHYNDVDHIVPIAHRLAKEGKARVGLFSVNPGLDFHGDFRFRFLRERWGLRARPVYAAPGVPASFRAGGFLFASLPPLVPSFARSAADDLARRLHGRLAARWLADDGWARSFLERHGVEVLVADHTSRDKFVYAPLSSAAVRLGIPVAGVPHGFDLMVSDGYRGTGPAGEHGSRSVAERYAWFDSLVVQSPYLRDKYARHGIPPGKMAVLGSTRFCDEWLGVLGTITPGAELPRSEGRLRVLYLDHDALYGLDRDAIVRSLRRAVDLGVDICVRKSTRAALSDPRLAGIGRLDDRTPTSRLVAWSDVVINTVSSMGLEALRRGKALLHPRYFHGNRMLWDEFGACWGAGDEDEFLGALQALAKDPGYRPYAAKDVEALWRHAVLGGHDDPDVLGRYAAHLTALAG